MQTTSRQALEVALAQIAVASGHAAKALTAAQIEARAWSETNEAKRVAYVLKNSPAGSVICDACDGYGDADPDNYDGRPCSRVCRDCDGDGFVDGEIAA